MPARRLVPLILLNVLVSATAVLAILYWWENRQAKEEDLTIPVAVAPTVVEEAELAPMPPEDVPPEEQAIEIEQDSELPNYTVQTGDTLGRISTEFDVPVADIMAINGIDDPNFLQVGQNLIIPIGGLPTSTPPPTETAMPALSPTPISVELPQEGEAIIQIGEIVGAGQVEDEAISIVNSGSRPISLLGWRLSDEDGRTYTFGQVTLFGDGAAILLHSATGQEGPADLFWGFEESVWQPGETATLFDAEGTIRATALVGQG